MKPLQILSAVHKASRRVAIHLEKETGALGVSTVEGHILTYLLSYAPCPISELQSVFGTKPSTLTSLLDRLERRSLIVRRKNPEDGRSWRVTLRPDGKKLAGKLRRIVASLDGAIAASLRAGDIRGFRRVMDAVANLTGVDRITENKTGPR